jgi:hypothetical protein
MRQRQPGRHRHREDPIAAQWGPNILFYMPNRPNCILLVSLMLVALCGASLQQLAEPKRLAHWITPSKLILCLCCWMLQACFRGSTWHKLPVGSGVEAGRQLRGPKALDGGIPPGLRPPAPRRHRLRVPGEPRARSVTRLWLPRRLGCGVEQHGARAAVPEAAQEWLPAELRAVDARAVPRRIA